MITLLALKEEFAVCKVDSLEGVDLGRPYTFVARTEDELSLVCPADAVPKGAAIVEPDWRGLKVQGELDFSLVGILAGISSALADAGIALFAISTYNTDYILVKAEAFDLAQRALGRAGYPIEE